MSSTPRLKVAGLRKAFGRLQALHEVSFEVGAGEWVGMVGPNGAGKSTTVKILTGQLLADGGQVEIDGASLSNAPLAARRRTGYVPQDITLYPFLTGREVLQFVAEVHGLSAPESTVEALLERLGLGEAQNRLTREYSTGMARKLSVACALVGDPAILVLDEALAGLDPRAAAQVKAIVTERIEQGAGVLMVSHALEVLERLADRVLILHDGRVVETVESAALEEMRRGNGSLEQRFLAVTGDGEGPDQGT